MCNNESADMRRTFPRLFDQLNLVQGDQRRKVQHSSSRHHKSSKLSQPSSSLHESLQGSKDRKSDGRKVSKRTPSLSASDIVKNEMDFTKTNPLAQDTPSGLQQRSEYEENSPELTIVFA